MKFLKFMPDIKWDRDPKGVNIMEIGRDLPRTGILARIPARFRTTSLEQRVPLLRSFETYLKYLMDYCCIFGRTEGFEARIGSFEFFNDIGGEKLLLGIKLAVIGTPPEDKKGMTSARELAVANVTAKLKRDFPVLGIETATAEEEHPRYDLILKINLFALTRT